MGKITKTSPAPRRRSTRTVLPNGQAKTRKCLMCDREFESEGPHNRICRRCKASQAYRGE